MKTTFGLPKKREEVINLLQEAYADGNLEDMDYENRLSNAMEAKSVEELQEIINDFPNAPQLIQPKGKRRLDSHHAQEQPKPRFGMDSFRGLGKLESFKGFTSAKAKNFPAILSSQNLKVDRMVKEPIKLTTVLGSQNVDFSYASIAGDQLVVQIESILGETVIDLRGPEFRDKQIYVLLHNFMGEVKFILPKGAQVDNQLSPILGEISHSTRKASKFLNKILGREPRPQQIIPFHISLRGNCVLGSVRIIHE